MCFHHSRAYSVPCALTASISSGYCVVGFLPGMADNTSVPVNSFFFFLQVDLQRKLEERNRLLGEYKVRMCISLEMIPI